MDRAFEIGEPDYKPSRSSFLDLKELLERQSPSAERKAKFESLIRMRRRGDLSNNVRSLTKEQRRKMFERYRSFFAQRVLRDENGNQTTGAAEVFVSETSLEKKGIGGQPNKDYIVLEAFFTWLLCGDFDVTLTKKIVINRIIDTAKDLSQSDTLGTGVGYRKIEQFLNGRRYWVAGKWKPENWLAPFDKWKTQLL